MKKILSFLLVGFFLFPISGFAAVLLPNGDWYDQVPTLTGILIWTKVLGPISKAHAGAMTLKEQIINYIKTISEFEEVDSEHMVKLADCESGFNTDAYGDNGESYGLYQWQVRSWSHYNKIYKTDFLRNSWQDQVKMSVQVAKDKGTLKDWFNCTQFIKYGTWNKKLWK